MLYILSNTKQSVRLTSLRNSAPLSTSLLEKVSSIFLSSKLNCFSPNIEESKPNSSLSSCFWLFPRDYIRLIRFNICYKDEEKHLNSFIWMRRNNIQYVMFIPNYFKMIQTYSLHTYWHHLHFQTKVSWQVPRLYQGKN